MPTSSPASGSRPSRMSSTIIAILLLLGGLSCQRSKNPDRRPVLTRPPNIILILADDLGTECLESYGGLEYSTPRLDQLARQGLRFTQAYSQPLCTNTRIQLMTGLYNDRNWLAFGLLDPAAKTFGHHLKQAGYRSLIAGKWQLQSYDPPGYPGAEKRRGRGMHPKDAGFDHYGLFHSLHTEDKGSRYADPTYLEDGVLHQNLEGRYGPDLWTERIIDFIEEHRHEPFFVYYPMALPHWPMVPTPRSPEWKVPGLRHHEDLRHFRAMVEYMDELVGRIVDRVDVLGLAEETVIIFYSDNGTHLKITSRTRSGPVRGGKGLTTDAGTRVPLIVRWPGQVEPGVTDALVDSTDFLPTLLDLAGEPLPGEGELDGVSFASVLRGESEGEREWVYCFYDPRPGWDKDQFTRHVFARDRRYKLYEDGRLFDVPADVLEEQPIPPGNETPGQAAARERLSAILRSRTRWNQES